MTLDEHLGRAYAHRHGLREYPLHLEEFAEALATDAELHAAAVARRAAIADLERSLSGGSLAQRCSISAIQKDVLDRVLT